MKIKIKYENLENTNDWIKIEREFYKNIISIWSNEQSNMQTINPWSSETFWTLIMHFKCSDMNLKYDFIFIIQWCFCLLAIQAFNRDWDLCRLYFNNEDVDILLYEKRQRLNL